MIIDLKQIITFGMIVFLAAIVANADVRQYDNLEFGVPGQCDQIVNREGYALGFSRKYKQPLWVAYRITKAEAVSQTVSRRIATFYDDPKVEGAARLVDYKGSGYDRGHLAPAGDMKFSARTMRESFSMANMSPQNSSFKRGVWNRLEQFIRDFAIREDSVVVVTGPIFVDGEAPVYIGAGNVRVPEFYYKVVYDETPPEKMLGFIVANEGSKKPVSFFALTVDEVEEATGLDFFSELPDEKEARLESEIDLYQWDLTNKQKEKQNGILKHK